MFNPLFLIAVAVGAVVYRGVTKKKKKEVVHPFVPGTNCQELVSEEKFGRWADEKIPPAIDEVFEEMKDQAPTLSGEASDEEEDEYEKEMIWYLLLFTEKVLKLTMGSCYDADTQAYGHVFRVVWAGIGFILAHLGIISEEPELFVGLAIDPDFDPRDPGTWPGEESEQGYATLDEIADQGASFQIPVEGSLSVANVAVSAMARSRLTKINKRIRRASAQGGHAGKRRARRGKIGA